MIEVVEIDGNLLYMMGDYNESFFYVDQFEQILVELVVEVNVFDEIKVYWGCIFFIQIKSQVFLFVDLKIWLLQLFIVK